MLHATSLLALALTAPSELAQLPVPAPGETDSLTITLSLDGVPHDIELRRTSVRAADFQLFVQTSEGRLRAAEAPPVTTFQGSVPGRPGAIAAVSLGPDGWTGMVSDSATESSWEVEPAGPAGQHLVIRTDDLPLSSGSVAALGMPTRDAQSSPLTANAGGALVRKTVEVGLDTDFEFFQNHGSTVAGAVAEAERLFHAVTIPYDRDLALSLEITVLVVRTTAADPYTSLDTNTLLAEFETEWENQFTGATRDLAMLLSGRDLNGSSLGAAYLRDACGSRGYGVTTPDQLGSATPFKTQIIAGGIAFMLGASNCDGTGDCGIMCSTLGGCSGPTGFGTQSRNDIRAFVDSATCFDDAPAPLDVPLLDDFEGATLDPTLWAADSTTALTTSGQGTPSGTQALLLDAFDAAGVAVQDRIITTELRLEGYGGVEVTVDVQHRGVPAGGRLTIEARNFNGFWRPVLEVVSDGTDPAVFTEVAGLVPMGALRDDTQIRITTDVTGPGQEWLVDDFRMSPTCGDVSTNCVGAPNSASFFGANMSASGSTSITANDLVLTVDDLPSQSFGILIYGDDVTNTPVGDGFLCVSGSPIYRLAVIQASTGGVAQYAVDQNALSPGSTIEAFQRQNFQLWYRDTSPAGFNFSSSIAVVFCP